MDDNDFYEDDESPEEVDAAWRAGEKGLTTGGHRDLNQRARSIVDRAVSRWDEPIETTVVRRDVAFVLSGHASLYENTVTGAAPMASAPA